MNEATEIELTPGNVKAAMRAADAKSADLWMVPVANLRLLAGFNIRPLNDEHVASLKEAIKANGYNRGEPLNGFVSKEGDDEHIINVFDGQHRLTAVRQAIEEGEPIEFLPVIVSPAGTSMIDVTVGMTVTADKRMALTPQDWATSCKRLVGYGCDVDEIAKRLGKSKAQIENFLVLAGASRRLLVQIEEKKVSATTAILLLKKHGAAAADVVEQKLEAAKSRGRGKVTAATLAPKRDLVAEGVSWIVECLESDGDGDPSDRLIALLAHLTGAPMADITARIEAMEAPCQAA